MRRTRHAKVVATLGPASSDAATIKRLFEAGADVFRLNFSHVDHEDHKARYDTIRAVEEDVGRPIGVLMDLQGPKLRLGTFVNGTETLAAGATFRLDLDEAEGDVNRAPLPHPEIFEALEAGTELLIDDGRVRLRVVECGTDFAETRVVTAGPVSDRKGVNVPGVVLPLSPLTPKDRADMQYGLDLGCDLVALSFVQRPEDIAEARRLVAGRAKIVAKLEKPSAIDFLDQIIELVDAVMVARGDLGVEMPPETVPGVQKAIIRAARGGGKPVIVATQMLESMVNAPAPTRAEASDVATAIFDGADAVMLSAESATGKYPVEAVAMMNRIIHRVEDDPLYRPLMDAEHAAPEGTSSDAITAAARQVAETIGAAAIACYTTTGSTALRAARERPTVPILCLTPKLQTARQLALAWGVHAMHGDDARDFADMVSRAAVAAAGAGVAESGDSLVITAGVPFGTPGATNVLRIAWVE